MNARCAVRIKEEADQTAANQAEPFVTNDPALLRGIRRMLIAYLIGI